MAIAYNSYIPQIQNIYFVLDVANPKCLIDQNTIKPLIDNDNVGNFIRASQSGTTTVESTTASFTSLAFVSSGTIVYNTVVPAGDISPYFSAGGNRYFSTKNKSWNFSDFTWAIWYNPTTFLQRAYAPTLIDWKYSSARNTEFGLNGVGLPFINYRITTDPFSSTTADSSGPAANINTWNFTAVVRRSGDVKFFTNGSFSNTIAHNVNYEVGSGIGIGWGSDKDASWGNFNGKIGPIITYSSALSDEEIILLYNSYRGRFGV